MRVLKKQTKYGSYQVTVTILEARHLVQNGNPMVVVKVGSQKKRTVVRERTDNPFFNEYFVFDLKCNFDAFLSTQIIISVYLRGCLGRIKFYGSIVFEVATVWDQPDHEYYHKWAMLTNPKDPSGGAKGYVKCNIVVQARGVKVKAHPETDGEDDIEGNLLLPLGDGLQLTRQRARYIFSIYRADGLTGSIGSCHCSSGPKDINPFVQISFAGMKGSTSELIHDYEPRFNEKIVFKEMFPPLFHRVRIVLKNRISSCSSNIIAIYILNLRNISHSGEYGFLPTFGPSFIHLYGYGSATRYSCTGNCSIALPIYRGRLLLSLKTEIDDPESSTATGVQVEAAAAIIEKSLWKTQQYLLVGVLYDVCMIDRSQFRTKFISFEINLGNAGNRQFSHGRCIPNESDEPESEQTIKKNFDYESQTPSRATATMDGKYNYMPLGSSKPCIYVKSCWPNLQWRTMNSNILSFVANFLELELEKLEALVAVEHESAYEKYNELIKSLKRYCLDYMKMLDTGRFENEGGTTKLDRHRVNLCRQEIKKILKIVKINGALVNNHYINIAMMHAYKYLRKLRGICEDHNLPDVFIWMLVGSKRVAYARLPASRIIYSEENVARGSECGERINLFMKNAEDESDAPDYNACKVEIFLWLGNMRFAAACWSAIPPGYELDQELNLDTFPRFFKYNDSSKFQLRAHVYQGRFDPGMDTSGLLDPFVRVVFHGYTLLTKVIKQSLNPFWNQTLIFPPVELHGTRDHLKIFPPKIVVEAFDKDLCGTTEFCGRCVATPVVKLNSETYSPPNFPPTLQWYKFHSQRECSGAVLAAFELIEVGNEEVVDLPLNASTNNKIYKVPDDIRPKMTSYRFEVIFWGVRDMKKINFVPVHKPRIVIECSGVHIKSEVMENAKKFSNFEETHLMVNLDMPEENIYCPAISIKAYDSRGFGCFKYAGVCIIPTAYKFFQQLITAEDYESQIYEMKTTELQKRMSSTVLSLPYDYDQEKEESMGLISYKKMAGQDVRSKIKMFFVSITRLIKHKTADKSIEEVYESDKDESHDWWSKYYASLEIYSTELEMQPQFSGFQDRLRTFELWRGKKSGDPTFDDKNYAGKFKGFIAIYRWPHPEKLPCKTNTGRNSADGLCNDYPPQEPLHLLVRLYVIKGINLHPHDPLSGKSDPYLRVSLGKNAINDRKNYVPNQLNPTFGRLFEMEAKFPKDYLLTIQVWDYDATTPDDLIGETKVDIENRFYSRHRAQCGIARTYNTTGYNAWRDREKPTQILEFLCQKNNLPAPDYQENCVKIGKRKFSFAANVKEDEINQEDCMALNVLHHWDEFPICGCPLVPEHLERRPLFNHKRLGLEQGKLEMWIDMFPMNELPPKPAIDISPQTPEDFELRVIIWNTENVPLVDNQFLTGEKCSDIYVKGWILPEDIQKTDTHYNSLTGEGNFNWRFVFHLTFSRAEHLLVVRKKVSAFARDETEVKLPCRFNLQVWDSDHFSPDDFLGSLTFDLSKMPKGSSNPKNCTLKLMDPNSPTVNLFKIRRTKAWWPFTASASTGKYVQAGKVEMEMILVSSLEAEEQPVGKGRNAPEPLPPPDRPDTSFSWFRNPWKACCFVVCRYYKWRILCCFGFLLLILLVACAIYAFPGYLVKRLLGA
ncbi:otoferlin-like [Belonocnema kinseyi]|uniref:otoferlin-like n=1 Tax=Belonocnema kinseyi TaxID=2817044 RepID=UPI00143DB97B|nr:otoferlin-like [Belonocnema kinseyi]